MSSNNRQNEHNIEDEKEDDLENEEDDDDELSFNPFSFILFPPTSSVSRRTSTSPDFLFEQYYQTNNTESSSNRRTTPLLSIFENLFHQQLDQLILDEISTESMQTYHQELLRKNDDILPSSRYTIFPFGSTASRNDTCFICMETFLTNEPVQLLDCHHIFHIECIQNAVKYNPQCPLCKQSIECVSRTSESP